MSNHEQNITELSVVVLCYHSGKTSSNFFIELERLLKNLDIEYEIVLVANDFHDSKNETAEIVKQLALNHPRVRPVTRIKEGMMGWDMLQGMEACTGKYICVTDGDGQFPIETILKVFSEIKKSVAISLKHIGQQDTMVYTGLCFQSL